MAKLALPQAVAKMYEILNPLEEDERDRALASVQAMLGMSGTVRAGGQNGGAGSNGGDGSAVTFNLTSSPKVAKWCQEHQLADEVLNELFHPSGDSVELFSRDFPGNTKSLQTQSCYLLAGVEAFLATGEPTVDDNRAMTLAKEAGCFDTNNNATYRKQLGNRMRGSKQNGFVLTAPGLRSAGELVREMA